MRITSGKARGINLKSPKGDATRPATDAARQAIFSSLGEFALGASVLDVFAGTGSYGLEAASRGAERVIFVENARAALDCLNQNIDAVYKSLGALNAKILKVDFFSLKPDMLDSLPTLIFADPPYALLTQKSAEIFEKLKTFCTSETLLVIEAPAEFEVSVNGSFEVLRRLGKSSKGKPSQLLMRLKIK